MWGSRYRCVIKPAYSLSVLLSINIFVWQNVLYFLDAPRTYIYIYAEVTAFGLKRPEDGVNKRRNA